MCIYTLFGVLQAPLSLQKLSPKPFTPSPKPRNPCPTKGRWEDYLYNGNAQNPVLIMRVLWHKPNESLSSTGPQMQLPS